MRVLKRLHNGDHYGQITLGDDNKVYDPYNRVICDYDDPDMEEKIDEYVDGWYDTHWSSKDYADYYRCDESDLQEEFYV